MSSEADIPQLLQKAVGRHRAGRPQEAEPLYRQVLSLRPDNTDALYLLGLLTQNDRRFAESADLFRRAVALDPYSVKYLINLGLSLGGMGLGRTAEAIAAFRKAIALDPNVPEAWSNLGNELRTDGNFAEAIECYRTALRLKPNFPEAQCNLGVCLQETEPTLDPAIAAYEKSLAMQDDFALGHWNLGFARMLLGDYPRGLPDLEWRFETRTISRRRQFPQPQWDGRDISGRTILIHAEQGLGDTIHMARYLPMIAARGARVVLECPAPLVRLLQTVPGIEQIIPAGRPLPPFDLHCPTLSLPLVFKTTVATIPAQVPYLWADSDFVGLWGRRLAIGPDHRSIGLAWAGRPENRNDRNRSMLLEQFAPLAAVRAARFFSLQKGAAVEQARRPPPGMELIDLTEELYDFADTAAMIANLDLVITVDTAVAHLAGAMGKPTWVLLPRMPDWRWMLEREDSPWYPTMRLFRQTNRGDWADVMLRVAGALAQ
jgi:Tfp pilus assembly protein PilF